MQWDSAVSHGYPVWGVHEYGRLLAQAVASGGTVRPRMTFPQHDVSPEPGPDEGFFFPFMERKGSSIPPALRVARTGHGGNIGALRIPQKPRY
ncbi:hypothetical protein NJLHNGOC_10800 [Novacetimonas cocois]|uniref:Uncharacterized protein n=1 Tax=Novacetimonas cocois TaxID=1747507 RepID=A0A365YTL2_9PROT|nr:hypothetical protein NJLHNGOC_10800 [Novacetimonas cocois]